MANVIQIKFVKDNTRTEDEVDRTNDRMVEAAPCSPEGVAIGKVYIEQRLFVIGQMLMDALAYNHDHFGIDLKHPNMRSRNLQNSRKVNLLDDNILRLQEELMQLSRQVHNINSATL